jgi:hypothetical protein
MKKHIFGFVLFGFIVGVSLVIFTIFKPAVLLHVLNNSPRRIFEKEVETYDLTKRISSKVEALTIDLRDNTINSRIKLKWNGGGEAPKSLYVVIRPVIKKNNQETSNTIAEIVTPRWENRQAWFETKTLYQAGEELSDLQNCYAYVNVFPQTPYRTEDWNDNREESIRPVVVIHRDYKTINLKK